jgi:hypothetical protein
MSIKGSLQNYFSLGQLVASDKNLPSSEQYFLQTDSEENYDINQPSNYTKTSIKYKFNSYGFRTNEFILPKTLPVILVLGCSFTLGIGLKEEDTWPTIFQQTYFPEYTLYNLGLGGASADTVARLAINFIPILKPDIVAVFWPNMCRYEIVETSHIRFAGPWLDEELILKKLLNQTELYNNQQKNKVILDLLQKIYQFELLQLDADDFNQIIYEGMKLNSNRARDNTHPGPFFHKHISNCFHDKYLKRNNQ